jgi:hypothetical protein
MEKETRKDLIKKCREQVAGGKHASRETFLAYAWLRDVPYNILEKVINEDHESFDPNGRNGFLKSLACRVTENVCTLYFGRSYWDLKGDEDRRAQFREMDLALRVDVYNWIQEKYIREDSKSEEVAA